MLVKDLKRMLSHTDQHDDDEVVIRLAMPSVGPVAMSKVKTAGFGFDWESGKFLLHPERRLSEKTKEEDVYDAAREFMMYLATKKVNKREPYEVSEAKRILKKSGYTDEDFDKYRHLFHGKD